jgi:hypothetical protein
MVPFTNTPSQHEFGVSCVPLGGDDEPDDEPDEPEELDEPDDEPDEPEELDELDDPVFELL